MDAKQLETTLEITEAMADELTDYLMKGDLYRQMVVKTRSGVKQPKMTIGALLENIETLRWNAAQLDVLQQQRLAEVESKVDLGRGSFAEQWNALLRRELKALTDSWKWYLDDAGRDPDARENYGSEAHIRTRMQLVADALGNDPASASQRQEIGSLDARLRSMLRSGNYVGPRDEEERYPAKRAWWLYGRPGGNG